LFSTRRFLAPRFFFIAGILFDRIRNTLVRVYYGTVFLPPQSLPFAIDSFIRSHARFITNTREVPFGLFLCSSNYPSKSLHISSQPDSATCRNGVRPPCPNLCWPPQSLSDFSLLADRVFEWSVRHCFANFVTITTFFPRFDCAISAYLIFFSASSDPSAVLFIHFVKDRFFPYPRFAWGSSSRYFMRILSVVLPVERQRCPLPIWRSLNSPGHSVKQAVRQTKLNLFSRRPSFFSLPLVSPHFSFFQRYEVNSFSQSEDLMRINFR